ncbi:hypothetical protein BDV25DRAFT_136103 [Aspergillus avenaceus]|uniref:F-box domain-containing protein n=1 Tax=Aspergillus avenaceus TaxID=36643 RepID=A0A5N6U6B3_ASPAV|nr:hypothetical protein BDV25DRAFT_136103 [Aspergillus avenaceus]
MSIQSIAKIFNFNFINDSQKLATMRKQTHAVFLIPEILEMILLSTDTQTLLTSQRVCGLWRGLIKKSPHIQKALFLKPISEKAKKAQGGEQITNPLLSEIVWPEFFCRSLNMRYRPAHESHHFPKIDPAREKAFLRPEASWRKMLLHQPPTERPSFHKRLEFVSQIVELNTPWIPGHGPIDLSDLEAAIDRGLLIPSTYTLLFWAQYDQQRREYTTVPNLKHIEAPINRSLRKSDLIIYMMTHSRDLVILPSPPRSETEGATQRHQAEESDFEILYRSEFRDLVKSSSDNGQIKILGSWDLHRAV